VAAAKRLQTAPVPSGLRRICNGMTHRVDQPILKAALSHPVITWTFFKNRRVKKGSEKAFRELVHRGDAYLRIAFCALTEFWLIVPKLSPSFGEGSARKGDAIEGI
jgi:hypothetical protein